MRCNRHGILPVPDVGSHRWHHDPESGSADRGRHHGHSGGHGRGGHHGHKRHGLHSGRKLSSSDLQLILMALLANRPAHGYELIKSLEDHSRGLYVPSPGMIYPALTYLEEIGFAAVETEGTRKRYSLTAAGRDHYEQNRLAAANILTEMERIGADLARAREVIESAPVPAQSAQGTTNEERVTAWREPGEEKAKTHMELNTNAYNDYVASLFALQDAALTDTLSEMERENLPEINVSASEGKLLQVLALAVGARRILEVGTLGGYSGIHFARALPDDGRLITLEIDPHHAEVARRNFERAGIGHKTEVRVGPAAETLQRLAAAEEPLFDLIFIDADKGGYVEYLRQSLPLLRDGGMLLADNTLPDAVLSQEDSGTKRYNAAVAQYPELTTIVIPVLRQRGIDGLTVSIKLRARQ